jgi:hypothetical protein
MKKCGVVSITFPRIYNFQLILPALNCIAELTFKSRSTGEFIIECRLLKLKNKYSYLDRPSPAFVNVRDRLVQLLQRNHSINVQFLAAKW